MVKRRSIIVTYFYYGQLPKKDLEALSTILKKLIQIVGGK